jgi:NADH dehydrogenase
MNAHLITVFGASGFVGRHTVRALAKRGYRIRAVTRRPNLANHLVPMGRVGQIQLFKGDVHDDAQVAEALKGAQSVVNLTGVLYSRGEQSFEAVHIEAAARIGRAAKTVGVNALLHLSAIGADPHSESYYAKSKALGETRLREDFAEATVFRPSIVFGPEDQFFNRFAGLARYSPALPLIGGGRTKFQPVFVGDVAAAIAAGLTDDRARAKTYELGGPGVYTFRELMQFVLRETGRRRLLISVPFSLATIQAVFLQLLPSPILTPDQVRLLKSDNVVAKGALTLSDLGISPTSIEAEVPAYLWRFRPKGQYQANAAAPR